MLDQVRLRPLGADDLEVVASWLAVPATNRWLTSEWRDRVATPALVAAAQRNKRNRFFVVEATKVAVGLVGLADVDEMDKTAMIWYVRGSAVEGHRGAMSVGVGQAVEYAISELGLNSVYAWIMSDNVPSRRVLERNGFREVGVIRRAASSAGVIVDRVYFDFVREV